VDSLDSLDFRPHVARSAPDQPVFSLHQAGEIGQKAFVNRKDAIPGSQLVWHVWFSEVSTEVVSLELSNGHLAPSAGGSEGETFLRPTGY
jgi:hypothetical protein